MDPNILADLLERIFEKAHKMVHGNIQYEGTIQYFILQKYRTLEIQGRANNSHLMVETAGLFFTTHY